MAANTCILILIGQLRSEAVHSEEHLLPFLLYQIFTDRLVSYRFISSMLTVCQKVSLDKLICINRAIKLR